MNNIVVHGQLVGSTVASSLCLSADVRNGSELFFSIRLNQEADEPVERWMLTARLGVAAVLPPSGLLRCCKKTLRRVQHLREQGFSVSAHENMHASDELSAIWYTCAVETQHATAGALLGFVPLDPWQCPKTVYRDLRFVMAPHEFERFVSELHQFARLIVTAERRAWL